MRLLLFALALPLIARCATIRHDFVDIGYRIDGEYIVDFPTTESLFIDNANANAPANVAPNVTGFGPPRGLPVGCDPQPAEAAEPSALLLAAGGICAIALRRKRVASR